MKLSGQVNEWLKRINVVSGYYTLCEFLKITEFCKTVHDPQKKKNGELDLFETKNFCSMKDTV